MEQIPNSQTHLPSTTTTIPDQQNYLNYITNPYYYLQQSTTTQNPNPFPDGLQPLTVDPSAYSYSTSAGASVAPTQPTGVGGFNPLVNFVRSVALQGLDYSKFKKKKLLKVVKSVRCHVCKIDLNSQEVLNNHNLGRKHKKNLEKLTESLKPQPAQPPKAVALNPVTKAENKKAAAPSAKDLETKKKKVIEGGAAQNAVKICTMCNVVCNSEVVFNYHLAGQKHASMLKQQQGAEGAIPS